MGRSTTNMWPTTNNQLKQGMWKLGGFHFGLFLSSRQAGETTRLDYREFDYKPPFRVSPNLDYLGTHAPASFVPSNLLGLTTKHTTTTLLLAHAYKIAPLNSPRGSRWAMGAIERHVESGNGGLAASHAQAASLHAEQSPHAPGA